MSRFIAICLALVFAGSASAQSKQSAYTQDQLDQMWGAIKSDCQTIAKGEGGGDALYQKCIAYQKTEWKSWAAFYGDNSVSQLVWDQCNQETHFNVTHDLHGYNVCIRLAKDRPDLKDNVQH